MRRTIVNTLIVLVLAGLAWYCYDAGKSYKILLENLPYAENGTDYEALEAINATVDEAGKPIFMLPDDRSFVSAVGKKHVLKIEILDIEDNVTETKLVEFQIKDLGKERALNVVKAYHLGKV